MVIFWGIFVGFCQQIMADEKAEEKEERKKKSQQMVWVGVCWMELYYMWCNKMMFQTSQETRVLLFTLLLLAGDVERNPGPQQKGKLSLLALAINSLGPIRFFHVIIAYIASQCNQRY